MYARQNKPTEGPRLKSHVKKGDTVVVLSGKDRGKQGKVLRVNPAKGIKKFAEQSRDRFLQAAELPTFFKALAVESQLFQDFFLVALLTGARRRNASMSASSSI